MSSKSANSLPDSLYSADAVQAIDHYLIDQQGVSGFELMQTAASAAFRHLVQRWPQRQPILVLCGRGNNGGDGYLVAASAARHGMAVRVITARESDHLSGDARTAWQKAVNDGVAIDIWSDLDAAGQRSAFRDAGLIVDALLGTGATGAPRAPYDELINAANGAGCPVLAIDVPSGLDATTGVVAGPAIQATLTVTFIAMKTGLLSGQGAACCGDIEFEPLLDPALAGQAGQAVAARRFDWAGLGSRLSRRPATAHKGLFGHVLIVGGDRGFGGAGLLAAEAAARCGAGLVTLATRPEHVAPALARCPSLMVQGVTHGSELAGLLAAADTIVCGPGLGRGAWGQQMLQQVLAAKSPRVLDADALNLMAERVPAQSATQVLTPHPGEAARLLGCSVRDVEADRLDAADRLQQRFGGTVLLKGAGTVVTGGESVPWVLSGANAGMATGGMGDVLSGMIGAMLGQEPSMEQAVLLAASLHLACANEASRRLGLRGLLPMDLIDAIPLLLGRAEGVVGERRYEQ